MLHVLNMTSYVYVRTKKKSFLNKTAKAVTIKHLSLPDKETLTNFTQDVCRDGQSGFTIFL